MHLRIDKLVLLLHVGVSDAERAMPQRVVVSLEVEVEPRLPQRDAVEEVVDYGLIAERVRAFAGTEVRLLETLAADIARSILELNGIRSVRISLRKPDLFTDLSSVGIDVRFLREPE